MSFVPCSQANAFTQHTTVHELVENGLDAAESIGQRCLLQQRHTVINVCNDGNVANVLTLALASNHTDESGSGRRYSRWCGGGGSKSGGQSALLHMGHATGFFAATPLSCTKAAEQRFICCMFWRRRRAARFDAGVCGTACSIKPGSCLLFVWMVRCVAHCVAHGGWAAWPPERQLCGLPCSCTQTNKVVGAPIVAAAWWNHAMLAVRPHHRPTLCAKAMQTLGKA